MHAIPGPCSEGCLSLGSRLFFFLQGSVWNYSAIEDDGMSLNSRKKDLRANESVSLQALMAEGDAQKILEESYYKP